LLQFSLSHPHVDNAKGMEGRRKYILYKQQQQYCAINGKVNQKKRNGSGSAGDIYFIVVVVVVVEGAFLFSLFLFFIIFLWLLLLLLRWGRWIFGSARAPIDCDWLCFFFSFFSFSLLSICCQMETYCTVLYSRLSSMTPPSPLPTDDPAVACACLSLHGKVVR